MHIEYRVNERDYRSASKLADKKRSNLSALEHFWPYLFAIAWVSIGFLPGGGNLDPSADTDDLYFELAAIPLVIIFLWGRRLRIKREYEKLRQFRLLYALDLDVNGLRLVTSLGTTRTSWSLYTKYAENNDVFILYEEGKYTFFPIAKQHLTEPQVIELRLLLNAYLPRA